VSQLALKSDRDEGNALIAVIQRTPYRAGSILAKAVLERNLRLFGLMIQSESHGMTDETVES